MSKKIRVAIVGVGNCASSLVQGVHFYRDAQPDEFVPGLMHVELGGYHVRDIEFSAAFDVNATKVGHDLGEAIYAEPNNTIRFADAPRLDVPVQRGPTHDGIGKYLKAVIKKSSVAVADVAETLRQTRTDVVVNYLPVGSELATRWYAEQALAAGCAFVNCVPVFIASQPDWQARFEARNLPIIGDDIKSQVGATIVHRVLTNLFRERGVRLDRTYQLNFGGNTDFLNMLERERLESKKISKTQAVTSQLGHPMLAKDVHVGPSDYVPWLTDRKWCHIRMEGTTFGNVPLTCEMKLEVWDSPNSAGVVIDAVRCAKLAMERGIGGALVGPSSYFMKSPPHQFTDEEAHRQTEVFIYGDDAPIFPPALDPAELADANGAHLPDPRNTSKRNGSNGHRPAAGKAPRNGAENPVMNTDPPTTTPISAPAAIQERVDALGAWFQNIDLGGVKTAPGHFLGDYPAVKWQRFAHAIPADLRGQTVLDIGCNAGFYSIEMKRRGATRVLGVDFDDKYLAQARFAAETLGLEIEFRQLSVYDVAALGEKFDVVLFMGVLYHLRHPLLALDLIREHVVGDLLVFQSMQRGSDAVEALAEDYEITVTDIFERPDYPQMYFVEKRYSHDPTNWWIPNRACAEAMLRSAGFTITDRPEEEVYICRLNPEVPHP